MILTTQTANFADFETILLILQLQHTMKTQISCFFSLNYGLSDESEFFKLRIS